MLSSTLYRALLVTTALVGQVSCFTTPGLLVKSRRVLPKMSMAPQGETVDLAGGVLKVSSVGIGAKNPAYIMILWV
jgi:hypothetical protein